MQPNMVVDPRTGDVERIEDILNELAQVVAKHGCALIHQKGMMLLVKIETGQTLRALADIGEISQLQVQFRRFDQGVKLVN